MEIPETFQFFFPYSQNDNHFPRLETGITKREPLMKKNQGFRGLAAHLQYLQARPEQGRHMGTTLILHQGPFSGLFHAWYLSRMLA
ncbi:hypothetical protein ACFL5V_06835 [Fibrobacterota bacterium]